MTTTQDRDYILKFVREEMRAVYDTEYLSVLNRVFGFVPPEGTPACIGWKGVVLADLYSSTGVLQHETVLNTVFSHYKWPLPIIESYKENDSAPVSSTVEYAKYAPRGKYFSYNLAAEYAVLAGLKPTNTTTMMTEIRYIRYFCETD